LQSPENWLWGWQANLMILPFHVAAAIAVLAAGTAATPAVGQPAPRMVAISCTNPASGATWQINVDYDRATVDANPAKVSDAAISWRDPKDGWNYTLDRSSGELTVAVASSTGGYFLHDRCRLPQ
jgi:hypothetical protein